MANNYYTCASCAYFKEGICTNEKNDLPKWKVTPESVCHEYDELPENFKAKLAAFKAAHPYATFSTVRKSCSKGKEYIYMGGEFLHARTPIKEQMRIRRPQP